MFAPQLKENGTLIIEQDLVRVDKLPPGVRVFSCPATRLAEELGKKMVLNIVMVGFFAAVTGLLQPDSLRDAIADSVPEAYRELNLQGLRQGLRVRHQDAERRDPDRRAADRTGSAGNLSSFAGVSPSEARAGASSACPEQRRRAKSRTQ